MNLDDRTMRIVVVGAGNITQKAYLPLLRTWPGVRILGLYSHTNATVESVCTDWQIDYGSTDIFDLLNLHPDAAIILTNTPSHFEIAQEFINANIDVYLEKPATTKSSQTKELATLASKEGQILMVGFNRRFAPLYQLAKKFISGHKILQIVAEKHRAVSHHVSLYDQYLDDTIHMIDLVRYYCDQVDAVNTTCVLNEGKIASAASQMKLSQVGTAFVLSCLQAGAWQERISIFGDQLTIEVDAFRELRVKYPDHEEVYGGDRPGRWIPQLTERGFTGELSHFFDCVRTRNQPLTDGFEAARTQELVEQLTSLGGEETNYLAK